MWLEDWTYDEKRNACVCVCGVGRNKCIYRNEFVSQGMRESVFDVGNECMS